FRSNSIALKALQEIDLVEANLFLTFLDNQESCVDLVVTNNLDLFRPKGVPMKLLLSDIVPSPSLGDVIFQRINLYLVNKIRIVRDCWPNIYHSSERT